MSKKNILNDPISFEIVLSEYNKRTEFLTRIWTWIIVMSVIGVILITQDSSEEKINIPILSIPVPRDYFAIILVLILSGMIIKWIESFQRIVKLRENYIESTLDKNVQTREIFDGLANAASTSVFNIIPDFNKSNAKLYAKLIRLISYLLLKLISIIAHFFLPVFSCLWIVL